MWSPLLNLRNHKILSTPRMSLIDSPQILLLLLLLLLFSSFFYYFLFYSKERGPRRAQFLLLCFPSCVPRFTKPGEKIKSRKIKKKERIRKEKKRAKPRVSFSFFFLPFFAFCFGPTNPSRCVLRHKMGCVKSAKGTCSPFSSLRITTKYEALGIPWGISVNESSVALKARKLC